MKKTTIRFSKTVPSTPEDWIPNKKDGDAGYDLKSVEHVVLKPGQRAVVNTGLKFEIPEGQYGNIEPRSGPALTHGIQVLAGIVDSSYRGEVKVILFNSSEDEDPQGDLFAPAADPKTWIIRPGDRIAQMVIKEHASHDFEEVSELSETDRGGKGFGSSGVE